MIVGWLVALVLGAVLALPSPPAEGAPGSDAAFLYLEPVREKGTITYVVRWSGGSQPAEAGVRVERFLGKGRREEQFGAADGGTQPLRAGWTDRFVFGRDDTGRPWPLVFPDTPQADAPAFNYRVTLSFGDTVAVQRILLTPIGGQWRTASKRVKVRGVGAFPIPSTFLEAQDQSGPPTAPAQTGVVDDDGDDDAAPAAAASVQTPSQSETASEVAAELRAALRSREAGGLAVGLVIVAGALYWMRRNRSRFGPSPEQRGIEGTGLLVMLVLVLVASGAMILRHFVER